MNAVSWVGIIGLCTTLAVLSRSVKELGFRYPVQKGPCKCNRAYVWGREFSVNTAMVLWGQVWVVVDWRPSFGVPCNSHIDMYFLSYQLSDGRS